MTPLSRDLGRGLTAAAALANTAPEVWHEERLATVDQLRLFLRDHDIATTSTIAGTDLSEVRGLRTALRDVFAATDEPAAVDVLNDLVVQAALQPRLRREDGRWRWRLEPPPQAAVLAQLIAVTAVSLLGLIAADGLARLHGCAADGCAGVFVDTTRNRSRRYCIPELCGNRTNLAAYRARRRAQRKDLQ